MAFGLNIVKKGYVGYRQDILIALAGPLANLAVFFISYLVWHCVLYTSPCLNKNLLRQNCEHLSEDY